MLQFRAQIIKKIRDFFAQREVLEVDTPLLCRTTATDPHIHSFEVKPIARYLQTSPEFAMKRLLAAGSGAIYQICKAFRDDEYGRLHNPEFTLLEWYRPGINHHALMDEVDALLQTILQTPTAERCSYQALFYHYLQINPHSATLDDLQHCAAANQVYLQGSSNHRDAWLQLLLSHCIEPKLGFTRPIFVYDFPASQAALARIRAGNPAVAERFEVYIKGVELANGYHELTNASEQRQRFQNDLAQRALLSYAWIPLDENLLTALEQNFPECAGVALGVDRLIMLAAQAASLAEVMSFTWEEV